VIPLVSCRRSARLDAETRDHDAVPGIILMEDAALRIWDALRPILSPLYESTRGAILAVCGSGNNAGDTLAVLRLARFAGFDRQAVILARDDIGESASIFAASLRALGVPFLSWESMRDRSLAELRSACIIVDGVSGTGLSGALRGAPASLVEAVNESGKPVASIDLPSGLCDEGNLGTSCRATWTLALEPRKACLYYPAARPLCGSIIPVPGPFRVDAAIEAEARLLEPGDLGDLVPRIADEAHKGSRGRVAVFAGSIGTSGAACLASRACLAAGAGLSTLFASAELLPVAAPALDAVMVKPEPEDFSRFNAESFDALLVGPGWGIHQARVSALAALLDSGRPTIVDADALRMLKESRALKTKPAAPLLMTPHPGEFAAVTGTPAEELLRDPREALRKAAREYGAVIVLKTHVTWIASPSGDLAVWEGMESGLGTAGSGDVLAGLAAGLVARASAACRTVGTQIGYEEVFAAARAAVIAHGLAGKIIREEQGWFEASALIGGAARLLGRL